MSQSPSAWTTSPTRPSGLPETKITSRSPHQHGLPLLRSSKIYGRTDSNRRSPHQHGLPLLPRLISQQGFTMGSRSPHQHGLPLLHALETPEVTEETVAVPISMDYLSYLFDALEKKHGKSQSPSAWTTSPTMLDLSIDQLSLVAVPISMDYLSYLSSTNKVNYEIRRSPHQHGLPLLPHRGTKQIEMKVAVPISMDYLSYKNFSKGKEKIKTSQSPSAWTTSPTDERKTSSANDLSQSPSAWTTSPTINSNGKKF